MSPEVRSVRVSRRRFLALAAAGVAVAALPGQAALAQSGGPGVRAQRFSHEGSAVRIEPASGAEEPEISVDGNSVELIDSNGAYRAAGFMYSPQPTAEDLAKRLVERKQVIPGL